jgi:hypothetical protein
LLGDKSLSQRIVGPAEIRPDLQDPAVDARLDFAGEEGLIPLVEGDVIGHEFNRPPSGFASWIETHVDK